MSYDEANLKRRMEGAIDNLHKEFGGLRTGRASASLLDPVVVDVYGSKMPLNQVGTVNVPEPRMISVQVWDGNNVRLPGSRQRRGTSPFPVWRISFPVQRHRYHSHFG